MPVMQLMLFGFIDQTVHDVPTVVVDQDHSNDSRLLMDQMTASKTFRINEVITNPDEARARIRSGRASVAVLIPPKFHDRFLRGDVAQVLVLIDGSDSNASAQALAAINGLVAQNNLAKVETVGRPQQQAAQPIILFNPEGRTANYIIPGLVAVLLQIVCVVLASGAIVREREKGTFEQLLVTPINPLGLMLGKLGPYMFLSLFEMTLVLALMRFGFSVPIRGNLLVLYGTALIYLFALLSLGLLISTRARTQMEAQQFSQLLILPAIFLSGYIFPSAGLPFILRAIGLLFPVTHMIAIMRGVVLRNAGIVDLWPSVAALATISVVLVSLAARSIHKVAE
jgi:ABC-2 type transport system permease protein